MNTGGLTNELIIPTFEDIISLRDFYYVKIRRLTHDQWVFQEVGLLDELKHFIGIITYFIFKFFQKVTFSRCLNLVIKLFISEKFPYHHIYIIIHAIVSFTHTVYISIYLYNKEKTCFFVRPSVRQHFYISRYFSKSNIDNKKIISELILKKVIGRGKIGKR